MAVAAATMAEAAAAVAPTTTAIPTPYVATTVCKAKIAATSTNFSFKKKN